MKVSRFVDSNSPHVNKLLELAYQRLKVLEGIVPFPEVRSILSPEPDTQILATYDHLLLPFSNRIVVSDLLYHELLKELQLKGVVLLADTLITPEERSGSWRSGMYYGCHLENAKLKVFDRVLVDNDALMAYQKDFEPFHEISKFGKALKDTLIAHMESLKFPKMKARIRAEEIAARAVRLHEIYQNVVTENVYCRGMSVSNTILSLYDTLLSLIGLPIPLKRTLISQHSSKIAAALEYLAARGHAVWDISDPKFLNSGLFTFVDNKGHKRGKILFQSKNKKLLIYHIHKKGHVIKTAPREQIFELVANGHAVPSTKVYQALYFIAAGFLHFGNVYNLCEVSSSWLPIENFNTSLIPDDLNSFPFGRLTLTMDERKYVFSQLTVDCMWSHDFLKVGEYALRAAESGKIQYDCDFFGNEFEDHTHTNMEIPRHF